MAYNNGFPMNYQPYQMYQPQYIPQMQQQVPTPQVSTQAPQTMNNLIWVQGEAGAKSYLVAPNNTVQLWDSERQVIYLKSADASGMPSMKILDYTIRGNEQHSIPVIDSTSVEYVTKEEFSTIVEKMQAQLDKVLNSKKEVKKNE